MKPYTLQEAEKILKRCRDMPQKITVEEASKIINEAIEGIKK